MDPLKLPDPETLALYKEIARHLLFAMVAGGLIGLERSYHGRPAGFRTHTLVCLASSLLMLVTLYQGVWFEQDSKGTVTMDPTRMAQGIMTGIGFLGAGVIFVYVLFFADSGERAVVQGMLMGSVVAVMTVLLLLLNGLDNPFHPGVGGLQPVAMERSLRIVDEALGAIQTQVQLPCDAAGTPTS